MKPLNLKNYLFLSIKQVIPQITLLSIKIALFMFLCSIGFAVTYTINKDSKITLENYSSFYFKEEVTEERKNEILTDIRSLDGIEKEILGKVTPEGYGKSIIFNSFSWFFQIEDRNSDYILNSIDGKLIKGNLPEKPGEIVINEDLCRALNKGIGDYVGVEEMLPKTYRITGIYKSIHNVYISYEENSNYNSAIFKVNSSKAKNIYNELKKYQDEIYIFTDIQEFNKIIDNVYYLLKFTGLLVLLITAIEVTLSVSNLNKVYFSERASEFAILQAVGYSHKFIVRRMLKELFVLIILGLIGGLFIGYIIMSLFYYLYCYNLGIPYRIFEVGIIYITTILSFVIFILSFIPVRKYISNMDWIDVIQQNNM